MYAGSRSTGSNRFAATGGSVAVVDDAARPRRPRILSAVLVRVDMVPDSPTIGHVSQIHPGAALMVVRVPGTTQSRPVDR